MNLKDLKEIKNWLEEMNIKNYDIIKKDGQYIVNVDVDGDVGLTHQNLKTIPVQFGIVSGSFWCEGNQLTSLQGAPKTVGGDFYCSYNKLTSLQGSPEIVGGYFNCSYNQLTSFEGSPKTVGGKFYCSYNQITSLQGAPKTVGDDFYCTNNPISREIGNKIENYNQFIKKYRFNKVLEKLNT